MVLFFKKERLPGFFLALAGGLLLALTVLVLALPHVVPGQFGIGYGVALQRFVGIASVQGLIYAGAVWLVLRRGAGSVGLILGVALLLRLVVLVAPPFLSNDMYRYVWDGWVQGAGINPYRYIPADPALGFLRDAVVYPNINRASYAHTIYPPMAELVFYVIAWVSKFLALPPVLAMKAGLLGFEGLGAWAMIRLLDQAGLPRRRIVIYVWNPVPVWEFASSGHLDVLAVCAIAMALLAAGAGRGGFAAAALAAAVLVKFLPAVLLPALWRRWDWVFAGVFLALIVLLYLPYLSVGTGVLGFLGGYSAQEGIDSGDGIFLVDLLRPVVQVNTKIYGLALAAALGGIGLWMAWFPAAGTKSIARRALVLGGVATLGISPHFPWYYAFLLVPACVEPRISSIYLVSASFLLYLNPTHTRLFWPACVFGPFAVIAACEFLAARKIGATT